MSRTQGKIITLTLTVLLAGGLFWLIRSRQPQPEEKIQAAKIAHAVEQINITNAALPAAQTEIKKLIFAAMIQKRIPEARGWCDTLNVGHQLWPVTPTNTYFALNPEIAGREYRRGIRGDTVVFFEAAKRGWNQVGGAEALGKNPEGVAVVFMDGRTLMVKADEVAALRWRAD